MRTIPLQTLQRGQALLVVILIMVVSLTVGLSVATRSITNTRLTTDDENSKRAFSAAEAGVQEALKTTSAVTQLAGQTLGNNSSYKNVTINAAVSNQFFIQNGAVVSQDDGADIWLVNHNSNGTPDYSNPFQPVTLYLFFGNTGNICTDPNKMPALEVVVLSGSSIAQATSTHYAFDPCQSRQLTNHMSMPVASTGYAFINPSTGGATFTDYEVVIPVSSGYFVRVIPLYTGSSIYVIATVTLPNQGSSISSTGVYGNVQRKIVAYHSYTKVPPEFFPYIIFSSQ